MPTKKVEHGKQEDHLDKKWCSWSCYSLLFHVSYAELFFYVTYIDVLCH